jgi:hypothetical protein
MSATWYETSNHGNPIKETEVERHTDSSVWITSAHRKMADRRARITEYGCYFPTWEEARDYLLAQACQQVDLARSRLERAETYAAKIRDLTKPEGAA